MAEIAVCITETEQLIALRTISLVFIRSLFLHPPPHLYHPNSVFPSFHLTNLAPPESFNPMTGTPTFIAISITYNKRKGQEEEEKERGGLC